MNFFKFQGRIIRKVRGVRGVRFVRISIIPDIECMFHWEIQYVIEIRVELGLSQTKLAEEGDVHYSLNKLKQNLQLM